VYSLKTAKNGRVLYFKDNKLISKNDIPEGTAVLDRDFDLDVERVERKPQNDTIKVESEPESRDCVVCGEKGTRVRFVNAKIIRLCEDHYNGMTIGEIAQALRDKEN
jgi:hypothetical protein